MIGFPSLRGVDEQQGQESSIAYTKCKSDIDVMRMDVEALIEKVNSASNTEGLGGIAGLFGESRETTGLPWESLRKMIDSISTFHHHNNLDLPIVTAYKRSEPSTMDALITESEKYSDVKMARYTRPLPLSPSHPLV